MDAAETAVCSIGRRSGAKAARAAAARGTAARVLCHPRRGNGADDFLDGDPSAADFGRRAHGDSRARP